MQKQLKQLIQRALAKFKVSFQETDLELERPVNSNFGDFSCNIAMTLFKQQAQFKSPREFAQAIADEIEQQPNSQTLLAEIKVAGPGFINFYLATNFQLRQLELYLEPQKIKQKAQTLTDQKYLVEYSSPNIAKPFTIGHLRSTIIGDAFANLLQYQGAKVYRDNHLGDWGTQFGKQIYALKKWGDLDKIEQSPRPVKELVKLYVKFHQEAEKNPELLAQGRAWFKKLEDGDQEARELWQKCIDWSWKEFNKIYQKLEVEFTENQGRGYGESFFEDQMESVIKELKQKKLIKPSKSAWLVFFPQDQYPPLMILKQDGATLYSTRDLATDKFRLHKYGSDITIINEVGAEQALYFKQLFKTEEMLGWVKPEQRVHLKHGLYRFKDKKMSTRKGNVIWLEEVLTQAYAKVKNVAKTRLNQEETWQIALGALKWNDLKRKPQLNIVFDWDEIMRLEGNSGPYVQYAYTRCASVLEKNQALTLDESTQPNADSDLAISVTEQALLTKFNEYFEVLTRCQENFTLHYLCIYLFELAQIFNSFYNQCPILQAQNLDQKKLRLKLTQATANLLQQGLNILGIKTLAKM